MGDFEIPEDLGGSADIPQRIVNLEAGRFLPLRPRSLYHLLKRGFTGDRKGSLRKRGRWEISCWLKPKSLGDESRMPQSGLNAIRGYHRRRAASHDAQKAGTRHNEKRAPPHRRRGRPPRACQGVPVRQEPDPGGDPIVAGGPSGPRAAILDIRAVLWNRSSILESPKSGLKSGLQPFCD